MISKVFEELVLTDCLPSPSGVGMQILQLTQGDDFSTAEIGMAISADSALTGRLLRLANSAESGSVEPITTVGEATIRLGIRTVRNVALGLSLISTNRQGACTAFDYDRYWSLSLGRAVAAQQLSRHLRIGVPAEMYILGLLADIGSLALASVHPESYAELLTFADYDGPEGLLREEESRFEINHIDVGVCMLAEWGLPPTFGEAARRFEGLDFAAQGTKLSSVEALIKAADIIARLCLGDSSKRINAPSERAARYRALRASCSLDNELFDRIADSIAKEWREWGQLLHIPTQAPFGFENLANGTEETSAEGMLNEKQSSNMEKAAQIQALKPVPGISGLHVLVVENNPAAAKLLEGHLAHVGHRVTVVTRGDDALRVVLEENPALVISSLETPGLDGLALCRAVRQISTGRKTYFLLLSDRTDEAADVQAFEAGVDDFLVQPFNPLVLVARLQAAVRCHATSVLLAAQENKLVKHNARLQILMRKLRSAALTDPLTGLPNRRYAMKRLGQAWETSVRSGRQMSVIMMDIDFFKQVNDRFGHQVGDVVLRETSIQLQEVCREEEDVCRMGGEEFLVICPGSGSEAAMACAERIRVAVEANVVRWKGVECSVTISLGVASREPSMTQDDDLIKAADDSVFIAKKSGRNKTVIAEINSPRRESA
jgi:diguanylate cyclase (GGDEF)-like protein